MYKRYSGFPSVRISTCRPTFRRSSLRRTQAGECYADYKYVKRSPLRRKTALKRKTGLRPGRPLSKAKPSVKAAQSEQRKIVKARAWDDDGEYARCEFEVPVLENLRIHNQYVQTIKNLRWVRCKAEGSAMAHTIGRRWNGKARDEASVVVWSCITCHRKYDDTLLSSDVKPRVPKALLAACRKAIRESNQKAPMKRSVRDRLTS